MLVKDVSKLYFRLGDIKEIGKTVYMPYTAMIKRWSGGFPLFAGRFYEECLFGNDIDGVQIISGECSSPIKVKKLDYGGKVYEETEIYPSIDNISLNIKYGSNTLKILAYIDEYTEFKLGDSEENLDMPLFSERCYQSDELWTRVDLEFIVNKKSLVAKLNLAGEGYKVVTDGVQEIIRVESMSDLKKYMKITPYIIPSDMSGVLNSGHIICNKNMHIIDVNAFESVVNGPIYLELPPEVWSLDFRPGLAEISFGVPDNLVIECLRYYSHELLEQISEVVPYVKRVYSCSTFSQAEPRSIVELNFNKVIYLGSNSINMLNMMIYNFGDSDVIIHESALFSHSDQCRAVFKIKNKNTLKQLLIALRSVREKILNIEFTTKLNSNIALVIVPDEVDIKNIRTKYVRIEHESVYEGWGYEGLSSLVYWSNIIKELKVV